MKSNATKQLPILFSKWSINGSKGLESMSPYMVLEKWNTLLKKKLHPLNIIANEFSVEAAQMVIEESENDQQTLKALLIGDFTEKINITDKEQYIKINQSFLIRILDCLYSYSNTIPLNENIARLYHSISQHLQSSLDFIEDFFSNYFNRNEKVPEFSLSVAKKDLKNQVQRLKITILKQENIDPSLFNFISGSIAHILNNESIKITYNQLSFHKYLLNELEKKPMALSSKVIIETLYYVNFNDDNFITYEYEWLNHLLENTTSNKEKIAVLRYEQKKINQLPVKLNNCFNPDMPSLKKQINRWIDEEVKYLENVELPQKNREQLNENEEKIHTTLSVAKLALLLRLLVVDKIIINRTVAPMLRVAAKIFTTLQKDDISFGSLETKYHSPDKATINSVRDMLFKWINILGRL